MLDTGETFSIGLDKEKVPLQQSSQIDQLSKQFVSQIQSNQLF